MRTHGHTIGGKVSPTWMSWRAMHQRCSSPTMNDYHLYGGRGITVCERWNSFVNFLNDMGVRPLGTQLDRKNTNGNYEPDNCRWVTPIVNQNNRRNTPVALFKGQVKTAANIEREAGWDKGTVRRLLQRAKPGQDLSTIYQGNSRPGGGNPASKFSDDEVRKIRQSAGSDRLVAKSYGVAKSTIYFIRKRVTYANVT